AYPAHVGFAELHEIAAFEQNLPGPPTSPAREQAKDRERRERLAAAAFPDNADRLAHHHVERYILEHPAPVRPVVERSGEGPNRQQRFRRGRLLSGACPRWVELSVIHGPTGPLLLVDLCGLHDLAPLLVLAPDDFAHLRRRGRRARISAGLEQKLFGLGPLD